MHLPPPAADRTCLVTGASSGIGVELARNLAARGYGVTLVARREGKLREVADELAARTDVRVEVLAADLTDIADRRRIESRLGELGLQVDILVNNAGFSTSGPILRADREREIAMIRTDIEAVVDLCVTYVGGMVARRRGAVLNVASTAAYQPIPGQAGYAASKSFVLSYTQALAAEMRGTGVTVTALCPGPVETGFMDAAGMSPGDAEGALPKVMWVSPVAVAKAAVDGLAAGNGVVIPGLANRAVAFSSYLTPRRLLLPIMARLHPAMKAGD
jgi:hypothetical protein